MEQLAVVDVTQYGSVIGGFSLFGFYPLRQQSGLFCVCCCSFCFSSLLMRWQRPWRNRVFLERLFSDRFNSLSCRRLVLCFYFIFIWTSTRPSSAQSRVKEFHLWPLDGVSRSRQPSPWKEWKKNNFNRLVVSVSGTLSPAGLKGLHRSAISSMKLP